MKLDDAIQGYWLDKKLDFSVATIANYGYAFCQFQDFIGDVEIEDISADDIRRYMAYLRRDVGMAISSIHTRWAIPET